ncbi:hypothetical protein DPMN_125560 [Dreissena polymorpha]|uniref:Uncharacterized protein n=1 Tax=Dreissena polymorpha TaxID=45954 RepID=A0A9D4GU75_DREPO|nr:hypothetical protein DPMN_125560 [Dreissena polymorpha]
MLLSEVVIHNVTQNPVLTFGKFYNQFTVAYVVDEDAVLAVCDALLRCLRYIRIPSQEDDKKGAYFAVFRYVQLRSSAKGTVAKRRWYATIENYYFHYHYFYHYYYNYYFYYYYYYYWK